MSKSSRMTHTPPVTWAQNDSSRESRPSFVLQTRSSEPSGGSLSRNYAKRLTALVVVLLITIAFVAGFVIGTTTTSTIVSTTTATKTAISTEISTTTLTTTTTTTVTSSTTVTTTTTVPAHTSTPPLVGTFLYLWYGYNLTSHRWTGGLNTSHWNDSSSGVVKDTPSIGYYASLNNVTLATQLSEMKSAGISVIIVSWWGTGNSTQSIGGAPTLDAAIDNATLNLFRYLEATKNQWQFNVTIMVEPFYPNYTMTPHDFAKLYGYLYTHYYRPYDDLIMRWQGKPLILSFNGPGPAYGRLPPNSTFTYRQVGSAPNTVDWYFWTGWNFLDASGGNAEPQNYESAPFISSDGEVGIAPRYDDYYLWQAHERSGYMRFDYAMVEGMYSAEWNYVLGQSKNVSLILLYSWNEYHERTAIEPHQDFTAHINSTYLLDLTTRWAAVTKATAFLVSNYNLKLGLISETTFSHIYWLYSDNFLAARALRQVGPFDPYLIAIANNISATIQHYAPRLGSATNQYVVLSGTWKGPCSFANTSSPIVGQPSSMQVKVTLNNGTGTLSASDYADIAFLKAICLQYQGNYSQALTAFNLGASFFNGTGFADLQFTSPAGSSHGIYQTYKLALYIYTSRLLSQPVNQAALAMLLKMQAPDGGFYSGYLPDLTHDNTASNTETTSLAILALSG